MHDKSWAMVDLPNIFRLNSNNGRTGTGGLGGFKLTLVGTEPKQWLNILVFSCSTPTGIANLGAYTDYDYTLTIH